MAKVEMTVNGRVTSADVDDRTLLVDYLRENRNLTGHSRGVRHISMWCVCCAC